jgi:glycosyltransferase involved in cell wall biosynthesis
MNIYLDGAFYNWSGIGRVFSWLVKELANSPKMDRIYCGVPRVHIAIFRRQYREILGRITIVPLHGERFSLANNYSYARIVRDLNTEVDVFHFVHTNIPIFINCYCSKPIVLTLHDLRPFTEYSRMSLWKSTFYRYLIRSSITKADYIITDSFFTQHELQKIGTWDTKYIKTIYPGMNEVGGSEEIPPPVSRKDGDYLLYVGDIRPHKNLDKLYRAFANVSTSLTTLKLVVVGRHHSLSENSRDLEDSLIAAGKLIVKGRVSDVELSSLYHNARAFVFPTLYEGYGIPPYEALTQGCPVICSDITVLRELYEEHVTYFNPNDENDIAKKIVEFLSTALNPSMRQERSYQSARKISEKFNNSALQYIQVYQKALSRNHGQ